MLGLNPALLDNPNDRETGVAQLLSKAQEMSNSAVMAANKLNNGFDLWGELLVSSTDMNRLRDAWVMPSGTSSATILRSSILRQS